MKKLYIILLLSFISLGTLCLVSCKKEKSEQDKTLTLKVEGYVREKQTGQPVKGRLVTLYEWVGNGFNLGKKGLGQVRTNDSGYYEIVVTTIKDEEVGIEVDDRDGLYIGARIFDFKTSSPHLHHDFDIDIPGYLHFYLDNKSQYYDSIIVNCRLENIYTIPGGYGRKGAGIKYFGNDIFKTPAGKNIIIRYTVSKKGIITEYIDSIDVPFYDTAFYKGSF